MQSHSVKFGLAGGTSVSPKRRVPVARCPRPRNSTGVKFQLECPPFEPSNAESHSRKYDRVIGVYAGRGCRIEEDSDNSNVWTSATGSVMPSGRSAACEDSHRHRLKVALDSSCKPPSGSTLKEFDQRLRETPLTEGNRPQRYGLTSYGVSLLLRMRGVAPAASRLHHQRISEDREQGKERGLWDEEREEVTQEYIDAHKTANGGWTRDFLRSIGVNWPPPKGWKRKFPERAS